MQGTGIRYQVSGVGTGAFSLMILGCVGFVMPVLGEVPIRPASAETFRITVTSAGDGEIMPDENLTLREAIALTNGDILFTDLSDFEQGQIETTLDFSTILFDFSEPQTIFLQSELPPLRQAGLVVDGTLEGDRRVTLTPDPDVIFDPDALAQDFFDERNILRNIDGDSIDRYVPAEQNLKYGLPMGFSVIADDITIKNFQFYGFRSNAYKAYPFVGAVVVSTGQMLYDLWRLPDIVQLDPPQNVVIENNLFGIAPDQLSESSMMSGAGLVIFDAIAATITNNQFSHLNGSAILTGKTAQSTVIRDNLFLENGGNGLRDAIRLEGKIHGMTLAENRFCGNSGAGIFLFKPEGAIAVENNLFYGNGLRNKEEFVTTHPDGGIAAVYLMGSNHQVTGNEFVKQGGAGVVVAAYPRSEGNQITDNLFSEIQGLSIDLVTRTASDIYAYQSGDGANPWRDSKNRRIDTGNGAVNAPRFVGLEFFPFGDQVQIAGTADPEVQVVLYRVLESTFQFGPLSEMITTATTDEEGKFTILLDEWEYGDRLSALAIDPVRGTSEPAENAIIRSFESTFQDVMPPPLPTTSAAEACRGWLQPDLLPDTEPE